MPFDPLLFLDLAYEIAKGETPSHLRTAVNRAYYAMFLLAQQKTGTVGANDIHARTIHAVGRMPGGRGLASVLNRLRILRVEADYYLSPSEELYADWQQNWQVALEYVEALQPGLEEL